MNALITRGAGVEIEEGLPTTIEAPPNLGNEDDTTPRKPPMYAVLLHNDDSTSPLTVIDVLRKVFSMTEAQAFALMNQAHMGDAPVAICVMTQELAETKVSQAMTLIKAEGINCHGAELTCELLLTAEPESDGEDG